MSQYPRWAQWVATYQSGEVAYLWLFGAALIVVGLVCCVRWWYPHLLPMMRVVTPLAVVVALAVSVLFR